MKHDKDSEHYIPTMPGWNSDQPTDPERRKAAWETLRQKIYDAGLGDKPYDPMLKHQETYTEISPPGVNDKWIFDTSKLSPEEKEALGKPGPGVIVFDDRLSDGTPCMKTEVAGLASDSFTGRFSRWFADKFLNMGRLDPMRKSAVFHDRLCDLVKKGEMSQERADELYELAAFVDAKGHQLGWFRANNRVMIVKLFSFLRRVGK